MIYKCFSINVFTETIIVSFQNITQKSLHTCKLCILLAKKVASCNQATEVAFILKWCLQRQVAGMLTQIGHSCGPGYCVCKCKTDAKYSLGKNLGPLKALAQLQFCTEASLYLSSLPHHLSLSGRETTTLLGKHFLFPSGSSVSQLLKLC